ncbi:MAG: AAA family ATPase [Candidatus Aureabacteria bacterium]|nr:AAA family ATPase [Candidatus Auribacterota bacterium]
MIIGLTGRNGSGKSTVAEFLIHRGFQYYSLSDIIREILSKEGKEFSRENLIETGNSLRSTMGAAVLAEKTVEKLMPDRNYVIDSIRNPSEVERLRKVKGFKLIRVEAPTRVRFERCKSRNREKADQDLDSFKKLEKKELKSPDPVSQQLEKTGKMADYILRNSGSLETLHEQVIEILKEVTKKIFRPGWDEYFMNIARVVAQRSNCVKRHVAAVIVRDNRIISTGYNGTPRGIKNCNEGGCPRCNSFGVSGENLGECLCSHAEENAITQAAYHGVSIRDATLYTTFSPCLICTKMIINSGIREVVYDSRYSLNALELQLLKEAGISVRALREHRDFPDPSAGR